MDYSNSKYVHVRINIDGKYNGKFLTKQRTWRDPVTKVWYIRYWGKRYDCTANLHDQNITTSIYFKTIKSATITELLAELALRLDQPTKEQKS